MGERTATIMGWGKISHARQLLNVVGRRSQTRWSHPTIVLAVVLLLPAPAFAHKLNLFAQARGATIVGRAYFTGDIAARDVEVVARDPLGGELGRAKTDDAGNFSLAATVKVDYRLSAETPDGHAATYVLSAAELPDNLPASSAAPPISGSSTDATSVKVDADRRTDSAARPSEIEALEKQIAALRTQIDQSEQRLRFRDILGGIGYILGLAGMWMLVRSRRGKVNAAAHDDD